MRCARGCAVTAHTRCFPSWFAGVGGEIPKVSLSVPPPGLERAAGLGDGGETQGGSITNTQSQEVEGERGADVSPAWFPLGYACAKILDPNPKP